MELNKKATYKGQDYYGRFVSNIDEFGNNEQLLMFDELLGDILSKHIDGTKEYDKEAEAIDSCIFCYVPIKILQKSDSVVVKWCKDNGIDI